MPALLYGQESSGAGEVAVVQVPRVAAPPVIDGQLDDSVWSGLDPLTGFTQREPTEGAAVSQRTVVRIAYDDAAVYIGAWLFDCV